MIIKGKTKFAVIRTKITANFFSISYSIYAIEKPNNALYSCGTNCYRRDEGYQALSDILNELQIDFRLSDE